MINSTGEKQLSSVDGLMQAENGLQAHHSPLRSDLYVSMLAARAAVTKHHKLGGLKQHKYILSQF